MTTTITLFLSKTTPVCAMTANGRYVLTLRAIDRQGHLKTQSWWLVWGGRDAKDFYDVHRGDLVAGAEIRVVADKLQAISSTGRHASAEIHGQVVSLYLPVKGKDYEARTWRDRMHTTDAGEVFIPPMSFKMGKNRQKTSVAPVQ